MGDVIGGLKALGPKRLLALGGVGLALLGLLALMAFRAGDPPEPRDAAAVVAALERQRIPYCLSGVGTQVLAPVGQVPRLHLLAAPEGGRPATGWDGRSSTWARA